MISIPGQVVMLGLFRLMTGLGIGAASAVVPSYISEIAPPDIRGRLGSFWSSPGGVGLGEPSEVDDEARSGEGVTEECA